MWSLLRIKESDIWPAYAIAGSLFFVNSGDPKSCFYSSHTLTAMQYTVRHGNKRNFRRSHLRANLRALIPLFVL